MCWPFFSLDSCDRLIAVWVIVAVGPVTVLHFMILVFVHNIGAVLSFKVAPVSVVFAVVPLMIVVMVAIVDANLHAALLRPWRGRDDGWCSNSGSQDD
jgi:hypothetical protein